MRQSYARKEVGQDEEDIEQKGTCEGGCFLVRLQKGGQGEPWQDMPQVKELKELTLLVKQQHNR